MGRRVLKGGIGSTGCWCIRVWGWGGKIRVGEGRRGGRRKSVKGGRKEKGIVIVHVA